MIWHLSLVSFVGGGGGSPSGAPVDLFVILAVLIFGVAIFSVVRSRRNRRQ
jgi:hypothetical protein